MKNLFQYLFIIILVSCINYKEKIQFPKGGYEFKKDINLKDSTFPFYPVRHIESVYDSTYDAFITKILLKSFDEINISLRKEKDPIFRLLYTDNEKVYFIIITPNEIVVKRGKGMILKSNEDKMSEQELTHLYILKMGVPISRRLKEIRPSQKKYLDSMIKKFPQLSSLEYYDALMNKMFTKPDIPFRYTKIIKSISFSTFKSIAKKINLSGYWSLPLNLNCGSPTNDGYSITFECNTGLKYNIVKFGMCEDVTTKFRRTCAEIIKMAGSPDSIIIE